MNINPPLKFLPAIIVAMLLFPGFSVSAQKKINPVIGKREIEASLFYYKNDRFSSTYTDVIGLKGIYRLPWKEFTKFGIGVLVDDDVVGLNTFGSQERSVYSAVFGDGTLFIGKRQTWSLCGEFGHGIFSKKGEGENATYKGFSHTTAGFYYSASVSYRVIISKNLLLNISPFWLHKNFRHRTVTEYYSPNSIQREEWKEQRQAVGLAIGLVF
jgi:hypothetical protein